MTVALVLAGNPDEADAGLCGQLAALGVRRVDAAERTGPGLLTVAAAARAAGERVLICDGADTVPEPVLARLLGAGGTAAFTGVNAAPIPPARPAPGRPPAALAAGALVVDTPDLDALAQSAESLAATHAGPAAVGALIGELSDRGVRVRILDAGPDSEGAVAQLLIDPAARDMARWAAWRKLTPAALYGISLGLGLVAAVWFAELAVRAKLLAVTALAASFLFARAGSLLAATGREGRIRPAVSWLGGACGLLTELAVYAGLAVSSGVAVSSGPAPTARRPGWHGLNGPFGYALQNTVVAELGRGRDGRSVAAGHRGHAGPGRPPDGRARLRAHGPGAGVVVPPVGAAHPGAGPHPPGRRAVRGDRRDLRLLRAAADVPGAAGLGRAGRGIRSGRGGGPVGGSVPVGPGRAGGLPRRRRRVPLDRRPG